MALRTIAELLTGIGTLALAGTAVVGGWFRWRFFERTTLTLLERDGVPGELGLYDQGHPSMLYHFKVTNQHPTRPAKKCRVMLVALEKRYGENEFQPAPMAVPRQFMWAPSEDELRGVTVTTPNMVDFGRVDPHRNAFDPSIRKPPRNFQGSVGKDEAVRFHIRVEAENFVSPQPNVFQVSWDGTWDED
ncbi:MAG TPA: hypothetical protein VMA37_03490 [Acetobacteraceae bacterium]|nr:hypothetical protein [Acetobacteraceae bacterium]